MTYEGMTPTTSVLLEQSASPPYDIGWGRWCSYGLAWSATMSVLKYKKPRSLVECVSTFTSRGVFVSCSIWYFSSYLHIFLCRSYHISSQTFTYFFISILYYLSSSIYYLNNAWYSQIFVFLTHKYWNHQHIVKSFAEHSLISQPAGKTRILHQLFCFIHSQAQGVLKFCVNHCAGQPLCWHSASTSTLWKPQCHTIYP